MRKQLRNITLPLLAVATMILTVVTASPADAAVRPRGDYETAMSNCGTGARASLISHINQRRDDGDWGQPSEGDDTLYCNAPARDWAQTYAQAQADAYTQYDGESTWPALYPKGWGDVAVDSNWGYDALTGQFINSSWTTDDQTYGNYWTNPGLPMPTNAPDAGYPSTSTWGHPYACYSGVIIDFVPTYRVKFSNPEFGTVTFGHSAPSSVYRDEIMRDLVYNDYSTNRYELNSEVDARNGTAFAEPGTIAGWAGTDTDTPEYNFQQVLHQPAARFIGVGVVWKDVPAFTGPAYMGSGKPGTADVHNPGPGYFVAVKIGTPGEYMAPNAGSGQREACDWIDYSNYAVDDPDDDLGYQNGEGPPFATTYEVSHENHTTTESNDVVDPAVGTFISDDHHQLYPDLTPPSVYGHDCDDVLPELQPCWYDYYPGRGIPDAHDYGWYSTSPLRHFIGRHDDVGYGPEGHDIDLTNGAGD